MTAIETPTPSTMVVSELRRLWIEDDSGGGFARVDLNAGPSLYLTAWNLRLATIYRISVPSLDRERTTIWLRRVIARSAEVPAQAIDGLPPLHRILLATQGLIDLEAPPIKESIAAAVANFAADGLYRYKSGDAPSWPATFAAVQALRLVGAEVPASTHRAVLQALRSTAAPAEASIASVILPVWQTADRILSRDERRPFVAALSRLIAATVGGLGAQTMSSGPALVVLASLREIALENGIASSELEFALDRLRNQGGEPPPKDNKTLPDPQVTYYAATLGTPVPERLAQTLSAAAAADGWRDRPTAPDPAASFQVLSVMHAFHDEQFDSSLRRRVQTWMSLIDEESLRTSAGQRRALYVVLLADELRVSYPDSLRNAYRSALLNDDQRNVADLLALFRGATQSGVSIPPSARQSAVSQLAQLTQRSMQDLFMSAALSRVVGEEATVALSANAAADFQIGPVYRYVRDQPDVELRATCAGLWLRPGDGPAAAARFWGSGGTWLLPPTVSTGNAIAPETVYLGFVVSGVIQGPLGLEGLPLCFI